jgi:hypothetical protein
VLADRHLHKRLAAGLERLDDRSGHVDAGRRPAGELDGRAEGAAGEGVGRLHAT